MPKEIKENWETRFDKIAYFLKGRPGYKIIKDFIRHEKQKLFQEHLRVLEESKQMSYRQGWIQGREQQREEAESEIKSELTEKK